MVDIQVYRWLQKNKSSSSDLSGMVLNVRARELPGAQRWFGLGAVTATAQVQSAVRELRARSHALGLPPPIIKHGDAYMSITESPRCPPETITTLLIDYTPIQNKRLAKKKKKVLLAY